MTTNRYYKTIKTALRKAVLPDTYFTSRYSFSPYMACMHGCKYCDGRAEKYYVEGDFETDIVIRKNLPHCLEQELPKLRERGFVSIGSGISDPYQPLEAEEGLMLAASRLLHSHHPHAMVMTKNALVQRDLPTWQALHERGGFLLMMSLVYPTDQLRQIFEPGASSVDERLHTLVRFKQAGMHVGVLAMPFLPFLCDDEPTIRALFGKLKEIGVDFVLPGCLTLRPGRQKELYFSVIAQHFPALLPKYEQLYRENRQSGSPLRSYSHGVFQMAERILDEMGIPHAIPHHVYAGNFELYDEIYILLAHMQQLYSQRGIDITPLRGAFKHYASWLKEQKTWFNRRRSLAPDAISQPLRQMIEDAGFDKILHNPKLAAFIKTVVTRQALLDYTTLKLR